MAEELNAIRTMLAKDVISAKPVSYTHLLNLKGEIRRMRIEKCKPQKRQHTRPKVDSK